MNLNPYPHFNGNCEEAFQFYEKTLGAKIDTINRYGGSPMDKHVPADWGDKVLHGRITIGGVTMMGSDMMPAHYKPPVGIQLSLDFKDPAEAERVYTELSASGTITMPLQKTFWASKFGMFIDRFGIPWMVNCE